MNSHHNEAIRRVAEDLSEPGRVTTGNGEIAPRSIHGRYLGVARLAGVYAIASGFCVLLGWAFDAGTLKSGLPGFVTMKPNTAISFGLCGLSLLLQIDPYSTRWKTAAARAGAAAAGSLALLTLIEYAFGVDAGIDQFLFNDSAGAVFPGRMAPNTALNFVLLGAALIVLNAHSRLLRIVVSQTLTTVALLVAFVALVGYLYSASALYGMAGYASMAVHTAAGFVGLSVGVLASRPREGLCAALTQQNPAGAAIRLLLPLIIVNPLAIGWLRLQGQRAGLYGTEFGLSLMVTATIVVLAALSLWNAHHQTAAEDGRDRALAALNRSEARQTAILTSTFDATVLIDHHGRIVEFNPAAERMLWHRPADVVGRRLEDVLLPSWLRDAERQTLAWSLEIGEGAMLGRLVEMQVLRADGSELLVELVITPVQNLTPMTFSACLRDITDRKRSTEQFRLAIEASPAGMITVDGSGAIALVNSAAEALFGYSREQLLGQPIEMLIPDRFRRAHPELRQGFFGKPTPRTMGQGLDLFGLRQDGTEVPIEVGLSPISTRDGMSVLASIVDITDRKQANADRVLRAELAERQHTHALRSTLAAIVDSSDDAIISESLEGIIRTWNPGAERLFGYRAEEIVGQPVTCLLPLDRQDEEGFILGRLQQNQHIDHMETTRRRRDGTAVHVSLTVSPIRNSEGQLVGASKIVHDITERKAEEARRETLLRDLEDKNAEMERFTYAVSHDLKSPLITIKSFLGIVQQDAASGRLDRLQGDLQRIGNASDRMVSMLDEVLKLSRLGRVVNPLQDVPMGDVAGEAVELVMGQITERGVIVSIEPGLPVVRCDRPRLVEVLQNLLDNAVKFMGEQPHPQVCIGARSRGGERHFFVRDNGVGIPLPYRTRVFGLFDKLDPKSAGSGVGLALVKRIVESHGGRIWIESAEPDRGTTFWFTLATMESAPSREKALHER